jgi:flavin-dependent dehydrogenase
MENRHYDIAIAGGGLAGLSLSILAAEAGYQVVLFEKGSYPVHKVCGEYISMESWDFLERLGVPLSGWQLPRIRELEISDTGGKLYSFGLSPGGFGISRYRLDSCLYETAMQKGVRIYTSTTVRDAVFEKEFFTVTTDAGTFSATLMAGCFGKRSNLDRKWNRPFILQKKGKLYNYIGIKYHISYDHPRHIIALHNFNDGYCGISGIENNTCCLCYLTTARNLQKNGNVLGKMEEQVLYKNPRLREIFEKAAFLTREPFTISQISFARKSPVEGHILMAGDAAGMITPLCGNGMSMAMHAGKMVFEQMDNFLQGNSSRSGMEEEYAKKWNRQFGKRLFFGRNVQRFFGRSTVTDLFLKSMQRFPAVAGKIIHSTHGEPF